MSPDRENVAAFPVVYVEWVDSATLGSGWEDRKDLLARVGHREKLGAAGFLVQSNDEGIVVCVASNPYLDDVASCIAIPRVQVLKTTLMVLP